MMMSKMKDLTQEHLVALFLNTKNIVIKKNYIYRNIKLFSDTPREVFNAAIRGFM